MTRVTGVFAVKFPIEVAAPMPSRWPNRSSANGYRPDGVELAPTSKRWSGASGCSTAAVCPGVHGGTPAAPGVFFVSYTVSLRGMLRDIAADARRWAPAVARDFQSGPR